AAGVLLAAERATDLGAGGAEVDVSDAAVAAGGGEEGLCTLQAIGEQRRRQTVGRGVLVRDRLLQRVDLNEIQDRREGLGLHDRPFIPRADDGGLDEVTGALEYVTAVEDLAARAARGAHRRLVALDCLWIDQRPHQGAALERIADTYLAVGMHQAL